MNGFKYQYGESVNPTQMNPEMLSQIMSEQGAGQGVDFNGEVTPNVSGEPSFADMYQEIKARYDKLIEPLMIRLKKLKVKLKENPNDISIKNEIARIEEKIDVLEQKEDTEIQQLEQEVKKSGNIIEQEKQMQGLDESQVTDDSEMTNGEEQDIDPEMMQQMMAMQKQQQGQEQIPMMQTGNIVSDNMKYYDDKYFQPIIRTNIQRAISNGVNNVNDIAKYILNKKSTIIEPSYSRPSGAVMLPTVTVRPTFEQSFSDARKRYEKPDFYNKLDKLVRDIPDPSVLDYIPTFQWNGKKYNVLTKEEQDEYDRILEERNKYREDYRNWKKNRIQGEKEQNGGIPKAQFSELWNDIKNKAREYKYRLGVQLEHAKDNWKTYEDKSIKDSNKDTYNKINREIDESELLRESYPILMFLNDIVNTPLNIYNSAMDIKKSYKKGDIGKIGFNAALMFCNPALKKTKKIISPNLNISANKPISELTDKELWSRILDKTKQNASTIGKGFVIGLDAISRSLFNVGSTILNPVTGFLKKPFKLKPNYYLNYKDLGSFGLKKSFTKSSKLPNNNTLRVFNGLGNLALIGLPSYETYKYIDNAKEEKNIQDEIDSLRISDETETNKKQNGTETNKKQDETDSFNIDDFTKYVQSQHPKGIEGFIQSTPYTQYPLYGQMFARSIDNYGRMNIAAQNQNTISMNPYTEVYDSANREYYDQMNLTNRKYDIYDSMIRRNDITPQYGSLTQNFNAKLGQDVINNQKLKENESNRLSALQNIKGSFGKDVERALTNMKEQEYKNMIINENERKSRLSAEMKNKQEQDAFRNNLIQMIALAGNQQKLTEQKYYDYLPALVKAKALGADEQWLNMIFKTMAETNKNNTNATAYIQR